ncbi:MAG: PilZ domain-containing protein [Nitrospirae bacterium]|nr:PilZ domain-containing protein [Nitrospirota bacterium]
MTKGTEGRRQQRYDVEGVTGNILYTSDLEVINISIDGAAIETTKRLDLNREYTFKVQLKDKNLNLRGRVVWAVLISKEKKGSKTLIPVYRAGIKFTDTLSEKANQLIKFIEENRIKKIESRLGGVRFQITDSEKVKIDYPQKYKVKKLSLSGMLIETEFPLKKDAQHQIELYLNEDVIIADCRVVNCEKFESQEPSVYRYNIGIEFLNIPHEDKKKLKLFLESISLD